MLKILAIAFLTTLSLTSITGCDKNTTQKTDQAVEAVDTKVEHLSATPNALQPAAKSVDTTIDAVHATVHNPSSPSKTTPATK